MVFSVMNLIDIFVMVLFTFYNYSVNASMTFLIVDSLRL